MNSASCFSCFEGQALGFDFTMALQPIVDLNSRSIWAQEALVRGLENQPAATILSQINDENRYRFDQTCRIKAIQVAVAAGVDSRLSINFLPNAVYQPERCLRTTIEAAEKFNFPIDKLIFEVTEGEKIQDKDHLRQIIQYYKQRGFLTAIDDFGAGYAGLNLLADFQPDIIKLDMALVQNISHDLVRISIVKGVLQVCHDLNIQVIAEGVETLEDLQVLQELGISFFQGYLFAKPTFEAQAIISSEIWDLVAKVSPQITQK